MKSAGFRNKRCGTPFVKKESAAQEPQASRALRTESVAAKFFDIANFRLPIADFRLASPSLQQIGNRQLEIGNTDISPSTAVPVLTRTATCPICRGLS